MLNAESKNKGTVIIIGAGIAGLSSAFYLVQEGWKVVVLEQNTLDNSCSYGNAGMIVPSHFTPLAAPGVVAQGIRWMFNKKSPFYVRPSLSWNLLRWGVNFLKYANKQHVDKHVEILRDVNLYSSGLYDELAKMPGFDFELEQNGIMLLYKTKEVQHEEIELAKRAQDLQLDVEILDTEAIQALEPQMKLDVLGGAFYKCDGKLYPQKLMKQLIAYLKDAGVEFHEQTTVTKFLLSGQKIKEVNTTKGNFAADEVVLATGADISKLAAKLGVKIPIMPGKGYSFMYTPSESHRLRHAALLLEARVAVTPMAGQIRFSGTMELGSTNDIIYRNRVQGIVESIPKYFPDLNVAYPEDNVWFGYRPCSPDGIPYLGRLSKISNVTVAGGAGMMGLSVGPAFGKIVADTLANRSPQIKIETFKPDRFSP
ncbi:FAD-dependent oxidoreductase [Sphingobacterium sp. DN00404]|uniref:FAD-dependent oxidoreductase n=1 Tax=Sphingobacterium micropteri TaxID=2763501 RepID=A0ABR7YIW9_9SPHI|nr:FAD-dependent oxidoreductase [Sphingobacterium micropteri]MBD1431244.1 FAD-dependent oxidoreductase [Sphingobacterium micropteri]